MVRFNAYGQGYFYFAELDKSSNGSIDNSAGVMTFKGSSKRLPAAKHLTEIEYGILCQTNMMHQRACGLSERDKYSLSHLKKVVRYAPDQIIKVYFECGDWFHYTKSGAWY